MQLLPDLFVTGATPVQTAQGGVVSSLQGICEQRGEDDPSYSWQGCEDVHVMLLPLPRLDLLRRNEAGGQSIELTMRLLDLPVWCCNLTSGNLFEVCAVRPGWGHAQPGLSVFGIPWSCDTPMEIQEWTSDTIRCLRR